MSSLTAHRVREALRGIPFEGLAKDALALGLLKEPEVEGGRVRIALDLPSPAHPRGDALAEEVRRRVSSLEGAETVDVVSGWSARAGETRHAPIPGVQQTIAVASGKGGVGKSTVAAHLAAALRALGARTGLLDLDIYGPSVSVLLGRDSEPEIRDGSRLVASTAHGLRFLSMGQLARGEEAVVWRGPMLHKMVMQLSGADWGDLDYLVLDLPPGTGDVQLTVTQQLPVTGALVVTTPQEIALIDARKGLAMFRDVRVPVLGLVENMALYTCRKCGKEHAVFGSGGGEALAQEAGVPLLARLPLDPALAEGFSQRSGEGSVPEAFLALAAETAAAAGALSLAKNPFPVLS